MDDLKTVEEPGKILDPLYIKQKEGVAKMRTSLLACTENPALARQAINNITVMRIYHQISRIIRYLEMMDKIEDKMYEAIDRTLDTMDPNSRATWMILMELQEKLQKTMIESHKLLQPYLDLKEYTIVDLTQQSDEDSSVPTILNAESREKLRNSAQAVLIELNAGGQYDR